MSADAEGGAEMPACFNFATDVFDAWARVQPEALALWHVQAGHPQETRLTFTQLSALSRQAAHFLAQCGIAPGDRVLLMLPRMPQWWVAMLALTRLGAVPVPATLQLTAREVNYRLALAQIRAVLTCPSQVEKFSSFAGLRLVCGGDESGWIAFDEGLQKGRPDFSAPPTPAQAPAIMYFTSATTGEPKMVLHNQVSYGLAHKITGELWLDLQPGDLHWNLSDLGWAKAAWSSFYGPWHQGAGLFVFDFHGRFEPQSILSALAHYPVTTWCAPPTALRLLVREDLGRWRFPHLRHCVTAGEPLNPEVLNLWRQATGLTIYEGYGQTETVALIANLRRSGRPVKPGSMGLPTPGFEVALLDDQLQPLTGPHQEGEIAIRVKPRRPLGLFVEYWNNPEETARQFQADWYLTGDKAVRDEEGYFYFLGRKDDVIKSSGYRIGPFEVESTLLEHPAVLEAGVVGKPDAIRGQIVKAYVVLRRGYAASEELKHQIQHHCRQLAAPYKYPREIEFVAELPKTISGKIRRLELRQRAASEDGITAKPPC
ncbi:AMP-binding protein [Fontisphaera persica]|uniref:AMP-binding protein n=1 Tax=Fontisphaera persica TaxID=2974023 RepID=UPI0024C0DF50|nr:AMP-binding protein [Fontisphaera persica]WCJ58415.1 AMP-binding protein [Fontisphaera persica]